MGPARHTMKHKRNRFNDSNDFETESPSRNSRYERPKYENPKQDKYRKRPQDYLEDDDLDEWDDGYDR